MLKKLCLLLLTVYWTVESAPSGSLKFDRDTNLGDLKYEVEEDDLDDFNKLLDEVDKTNNKAKTNIKTTGYKKKTASNEGSKSKHNIGDFKKFYKSSGLRDHGEYDDNEIYAQAEGYTGLGVGITGSEDQKYKKGTKTRGFHRVHHKDEYKKDKVFYEDDETSGAVNKVGAEGFGYKLKAGAGFNKGDFHHARHKGVYGKRGYSDKGFSDKEFGDYGDSQGFDGSFSKEN